MKKLSDYARENKIKYSSLYSEFRNGSDRIVKENGTLYYKEATADAGQSKEKTRSVINLGVGETVFLSEAADLTRSNVSTKATYSDRYANIENGFYPFFYDRNSSNDSGMSIRDIIILMEKAYHNFAILRNTISLMVEFSTAGIYFTGGNPTSRKWFESYFREINIFDIQNQFYREFYRSANVFIYPLKGKVDPKILKRISTAATTAEIPFKYVFLQPADIELVGQTSFAFPVYRKRLNPYELEVLKNPKTDSDQAIFDNLPPETQKAILGAKKGGANTIEVYLDLREVYAVFNGKQDYEPFGVPMFFPILEDLNRKEELKKLDMALMRTTNQCILLITMGTELKDGGIHLNVSAMQAIQNMFSNPSVGRTIVADWTTQAKFVVPEIDKILDPIKYQTLNEDINIGLNNILGGGEKFANAFMKTQIFMERLQQGREYFLNNFLIPEIKKISDSMGFKNIPTPHYEELNLKDELEFAKVYTRLVELGVLTANEGIDAITSGKLPTKEESLENQKEYVDQKNQGFYSPITSPSKEIQDKNSAQKAMGPTGSKIGSSSPGRPTGGNKKIGNKKISPIGASEQPFEGKFLFSKIKENTILASQLETELVKELKQKYGKKKLTNQQSDLALEIVKIIIINETPDKWINSISEYIETPVDKNQDRVNEAMDIGSTHGLGLYESGILLNSQDND